MSFNKKIYICETCGYMIIGEEGFNTTCTKENCIRKQANKKDIKENTLVIPEKDIRVGGC
jgi:hypothetical protein